jgi:galactose mutarotase-like enzyme
MPRALSQISLGGDADHPRVDTRWALCGLDTVIIENARLRLVVLPELGGKILQLTSKRQGFDWLWNNPRVPPRRAPYGADFDNYFVGGWDQPFPTLEACQVEGEQLPYVGELWSVPWQWRESSAAGDGVSVEMQASATIFPARLYCRLELGDGASFSMAYRLESLGTAPFKFTWGLHPCFAIDPATRFEIPAGRATVIQSPEGGVGPEGTAYSWPNLIVNGQWRNIGEALPRTARVYGLHELQLQEGWFAVVQADQRLRLRVNFPLEVYPVIYLWMVYGGWRGIYHAAVEPWTGGGTSLAQAIEAGAARTLQPGESLEAVVTVTIDED